MNEENIRIMKQNDNVTTLVKEFVADSEADVANLPTARSSVAPGSVCIVTETSDVYMLNTKYEWVKL